MRKPINKQQEIIDFAKNNGDTISTSQAIKLLEKYYYSNADKYIGEILKRMVNNAKLIKTHRGIYKINKTGSKELTLKIQLE